jgi:hypothetical protein
MTPSVDSETHADNISSKCTLLGLLSNSCSLSPLPHSRSGSGPPHQLIWKTRRYIFLEFRTKYSTNLCQFIRFDASPTTETPVIRDILFMQLPRLLSLARLPDLTFPYRTHPTSRTPPFVIKCEIFSDTTLLNQSG